MQITKLSGDIITQFDLTKCPPDVHNFLTERGWTYNNSNDAQYIPPNGYPYDLFNATWAEALAYEQFRWWSKLHDGG